MIEIKEYEEKYAEEISNIVTRNLLEINIKDYGLEFSKKHAEEFTVDKIKENFKNRTKTYVALKNNNVVGTAGLDKSWYNDDGEYWILSVFVKPENHSEGIGKSLINKVEEYAKEINAKKLVVPASITACEFYHKLGYEYANGKKELNEEQMYIMEKYLCQ
jgi:N-acetylglutamate synthase-like GNAT family acetyltransferase